MLKHIRKQLAQHRLIGETTQGICIQEVTNNVVDNQMQLDYEGSDQELEEIEVVDNLKPVDVMHMLEQIKTMTITSTDRKFVENCDYIHKKVQEMLSGNAIRKGGLKYFAKFTGKHLCQNLFFNEVACLGVSSIMFSTTLLKRDSQACSFMKKETLAQVISCEFFEIFRRTLFLKNTSGSCFWIYLFQAGL